MSGGESEYEVETIVCAKAEGYGRSKRWLYQVKWKGYDEEEDNTWEPKTSFEGAEHFVTTFWKRVPGVDESDLKMTDVNKVLYPMRVGPPGKRKAPQPATPAKDRAKAPALKAATSEEEVRSIIDVDEEEVVRTSPRRKRRNSAMDEPAESRAPKRQRGRTSRDDVEESASAGPRVTRNSSAHNLNARTANGASSTSHARPVSRRSARSRSRVANRKRASSPDTVLIETQQQTSESEPEFATARTGRPSKPSPRKTPIKPRRGKKAAPTGSESEVEGSIVPESPEAFISADEKPVASSSKRTLPRRGPPGIPAKSLGAKAETSTSQSAKTRATRKTEVEAVAHPKPSSRRAAAPRPKPGPGRSSAGLLPRPTAPRAKPGPGRSSKGMTVEVESRATRSKDTKPASQKTRAAPAKKQKQAEKPVEISDEEDAMDVDEPVAQPNSDEHVEHPPSPERVPPSSDAHDLAGGDFTDADAEGEDDHGSEHHADVASAAGSQVERTPGEDAEEMVLPEAEEAVPPPGYVQPVVSDTQEAEKQPNVEVEEAQDTKAVEEPFSGPSGIVINRPNATIGNTLASKFSRLEAWRKSGTIFDALSTGRSFFGQRQTETTEGSKLSEPAVDIPLGPAVHLPVILKEIHPSTDSTRKSLNDIIAQNTSGPPGKFYKDQNMIELVNSFSCEGSCSQVVLKPDADAVEKQNFERFYSQLKDGSLFVAMIGTNVLTFASSTNAELVARLGMSPNLVGLGDNVLVSEVVITNYAAYCDAAMNAEDVRW